MPRTLTDARIVITGGTGSLGQAMVRRLLIAELGCPASITVFSRGEVKQHEMRLAYQRLTVATDEVIYNDAGRRLQFVIGDVRDYHAVCGVLRDADIVVHAAALKQVPTCEYFPAEAVATNVLGAENIVRAIREHRLPIEVVVGVSSDKAVAPINVYGMTKAIQERLFTTANLACSQTRFVCVRYGNVLNSRGSIMPLFREQIRLGGPVTITSENMTRFLITLDHVVDAIFTAITEARRGEVYVPLASSARIVDLARVMIGNRPIAMQVIGARPGEKTHEVLVSEEECRRTAGGGGYYVVQPVLPELRGLGRLSVPLTKEYSSADELLGLDALRALLASYYEEPRCES